jgi:hypothetical protein
VVWSYFYKKNPREKKGVSLTVRGLKVVTEKNEEQEMKKQQKSSNVKV